MSSPSKQERLRLLIEEQQERIRQTFPPQRGSAIASLTRARDWQYLQGQDPSHAGTAVAPLLHSPLYASGWHKALQFCFSTAAQSASSAPLVPASTLDVWADQVLLECDRLSAGEQVLAHCESGFMRMDLGGQKEFSVWIASKKMPTEWREREDLVWWTNTLATTYEREMQELAVEKGSLQPQLNAFAREWQAHTPIYKTTQTIDDYYRRLGRLRVKSMACHLLYPAQTLIGGCTVDLYGQVLAELIGWALKHLDLCRAVVALRPSCPLRMLLAPNHAADALIAALSETLGVDAAPLRRAVDAYSLAPENVSSHCSAAGVPAPPLLRLDEQHLIWSLTGLLSEPFLFLTRELKRRYSYEYHAAAHLREAVFRQDLYHLFSDPRFVRSADRIELRGVQGDLTTDIDALIFDRKTGALALFELKSQDPFAYSRQERIRQCDYFYQAGKQVLACVQWLNRHGANALLARLDPKRVKRLKAQKTYLFVLGRYLAHFFEGPAFDHRAAWGTWPQVLRVAQAGFFGAEDAHPIQSLYHNLLRDTPLIPSRPVLDMQEIPIGESKVYVYPDFQTFKDQGG